VRRDLKFGMDCSSAWLGSTCSAAAVGREKLRFYSLHSLGVCQSFVGFLQVWAQSGG
jgi:hypothetical protein